jgi:DNA-binding NarL/FixJ family response regulator
MAQTAKRPWESWLDTKVSYYDSRRKMSTFINKTAKKGNRTIHDVVDLEKAREMKRELVKTEEEIEKKILYSGLDAFSDEDIMNSNLTELEIKILDYKCKEHYSFGEISEKLNIPKSTVFKTYVNAKEKIEKYNKLKKENRELNILTFQQKEIYKLLKEGNSNCQIATQLNTSVQNIKNQKRKISMKLKGGNQKSGRLIRG